MLLKKRAGKTSRPYPPHLPHGPPTADRPTSRRSPKGEGGPYLPLEVERQRDFHQTRRNDGLRCKPRCIGAACQCDRVGVEHVEQIETHHRPALGESDDLSEA